MMDPSSQGAKQAGLDNALIGLLSAVEREGPSKQVPKHASSSPAGNAPPFRTAQKLASVEGPHDARTHARVLLPKFKPANTAYGPGPSMGTHVRWVYPSMGRESQGAGRSRIR
jgi:hypothetical protein